MSDFLLSDFISEEDFVQHVSDTITNYEKSLKSINLSKFNSNVVDPIKLTFDMKLMNKTIDKVIEEELQRQRDKRNNNLIGYFHQNIFKYIKKCSVPKKGFDILVEKDDGSYICVEMKNKHNTMNSSSSLNTYIKMQKEISKHPNNECYLVEAISTKSRNIVWEIEVENKKNV